MPMKRRNNDGDAPGCSTTAAAGVAPVVGLVADIEDDEEDIIGWLLRASENKFRRMSRDMRKLKKKEYVMKGHHLPVER